MRLLSVGFGILVCYSWVGCGDNGPPTTDSSVQQDTLVTDSSPSSDNTLQDQTPTTDTETAQDILAMSDGDGPTAPLNCDQTSICAETCCKGCPSGIEKFTCLLKCNNDCKALGCPSAQPLFDKVTSCVQTNCLVECMGGPGASCTTCTLNKCASEVDTCKKHSC
ncbi:MAG: hypothetical protein V1754_12105 [Pseudomonadota bacterium]